MPKPITSSYVLKLESQVLWDKEMPGVDNVSNISRKVRFRTNKTTAPLYCITECMRMMSVNVFHVYGLLRTRWRSQGTTQDNLRKWRARRYQNVGDFRTFIQNSAPLKALLRERSTTPTTSNSSSAPPTPIATPAGYVATRTKRKAAELKKPFATKDIGQTSKQATKLAAAAKDEESFTAKHRRICPGRMYQREGDSRGTCARCKSGTRWDCGICYTSLCSGQIARSVDVPGNARSKHKKTKVAPYITIPMNDGTRVVSTCDLIYHEVGHTAQVKQIDKIIEDME